MIGLLYRIGRAVGNQGVGNIAAAAIDPTLFSAANLFGKVAADVWKDIRADKKQDKLNDDILAAAKLTFEEAKQEAVEVARKVTDDPVLQRHIESIITLIPASIKASLRSPADPTGTTLPAGYVVRDADDLVKLFPPRLPRFKAGDTPAFLRGWRLVEQIGAGGFGEVWKVHNVRATNKVGAVKFGHGLSEAEQSLLNEGDVLNRLIAAGDHPGIVPLQDVWADGDEVPWIRYDCIEGGDLTGLIHRWQKLEPAERVGKVVEALADLAATVGFCHGLSPAIVHRDLKPSNILYDAKTRRLRVCDFGIGAVSSRRSLSESGTRGLSVGAVVATYLRGSHTPLYASPQQRAGSHEVDPRDDVHALGVIAFQMMTGHLSAAPGADFEDDLRDHGATDELIALVKSCVAREPNRRPKDAMELHRRLQTLTGKASSTIAQVQSALPESQKPSEAAPKLIDAPAMFATGWQYDQGDGVTQDYAEAMRWYRKAADAGNADAMGGVGVLFGSGRGVRRDYAEAMRWYRMAADAGHTGSMCNAGWLFMSGKGVSRDYAEAMRWYRMAADAGNTVAMFNIGGLYVNGKGVPKDYAEAMRWYCMAADAGNAAAMRNIGVLFENGLGMRKNIKVARSWYQRAMEFGHKRAKKDLRRSGKWFRLW